MKKRGQVWIETVIYTLIAFVMIGLVLAYAKPKIEEFQDKAIIEQTIKLMKDIDFSILIMGGPGNQRIHELVIKKGLFEIRGGENSIVFEMESKHQYSEPGMEISNGNLIILTGEEKDKLHIVTLTRNYDGERNITYQGKDESKTLTKASLPYYLLISNKGETLDIELN
jgi:hypothetical protein